MNDINMTADAEDTAIKEATSGLSPTEKVKLAEIMTALEESSLLWLVVALVLALARAVAVFRVQNRDGRGVKHAAGKQIGRFLDRILHAIGHAEKHPDGNVRREAAKLVRSVQYETFEQLQTRASKFVGLLRKSGHRRNERQQREQAWSADLNDGCVLAEVATPDALREVGRRNKLCVANRGIACDYLADSRCFTLSHQGQFACLLNVDNDDEVSEISGPGNDDVHLSRKRALEVLEVLDATGDRVDAFAGVGALSPYLFGGGPDARGRLVVNRRQYRLDVFAGPRQVVVRERSRKNKRWSLFELRTPRDGRGLAEWRSVYWGAIGLGQFTALLQQGDVAAKITGLFA